MIIINHRLATIDFTVVLSPNAGCHDEVFRPSLINEPLHEAVEVWRGAKVILVPATDGTLKCYVRTLGKEQYWGHGR